MTPDAYLEMAKTESRHWWFCGRRAILDHVIGKLRLPDVPKILEIGCGTGGNLEMLSAHGQLSAMEMDATARSIALEKTNGEIDIRSGRCPEEIPFSDERFDLICLFDVLEHIEEDRETLCEISRLLTDDGLVLVTVPAYQWLWSAHDEFLHHKRRYSMRSLRKVVTSSDLQITKLSYFNTFLFPLAVVARLTGKFFGSSGASGSAIPLEPMNRTLAAIFRAERFVLDRMRIPFGMSLIGVMKKNDSQVHAGREL
ncbi:MAG: class I SAM-dependent methyltransferase [Proteobacteria bacterium]|nr:class I SAM-dependent methyltransferase [Pseudomonadota bacterium]